MIGPGTGIAPFIAFCQEKESLMEKGNFSSLFTKSSFIQKKKQKTQNKINIIWLKGINICPGEFTLYFGCRHKEGDYIFKEEIEQYSKKNIINKLYVAFSRDQVKINFLFYWYIIKWI